MRRTLVLLTLALLAMNTVWAQCSNFSIVANKSSACKPDIVRYHVLNAIPNSSYQWNVGLGNVTGSDTLFAFYNATGIYDATVRITLPDGTVCTISENDILEIRDVPQPQFTASKLIMCNGPELVEFTDITPGSVSRNWIIDGTNYNNTSDSIAHQFVTSGSKQVSLVVTDSFGCEGVAQFADTIKIYPELDFNFRATKRSGCIPQTIDFVINKDVNTPFNESYRWSFPGSDKVKVSGKNPGSRTYTQEGNFDVTLTITLDNGCSYDLTKPSLIKLGKEYPLDLDIQNAVACGDVPVILKLKNDSLPGKVDWTIEGLTGVIDTISKFERHFYPRDSGDLSITIKHEQYNCPSERSYSIVVDRNNVLADFYSDDNYHCYVPHTVHLWNQSDTMDANSLNYTWNIYEGSTLVHTSNAEHDSITFTKFPGNYDVELIAIGDNGCSDTMRMNSFIYQDTMKLDFTPQPYTACAGQEILFANNTRPTSFMSPDEFIWTFYALDDSTILDTSHLESPTMVYYDTGYYDVMVTGMNSIGCKDTLEVPMAVHVINTNLDYTVNKKSLCQGESFLLIGRSTPIDAEIEHVWTFIDRESSAEIEFVGDTVFANLQKIGLYDLVISSNIMGGCVKSDTIEVSVNGLEAELLFDATVICNPAVIYPELLVNKNNHSPLTDTTLDINWSIDPINFGTISSNGSKQAEIQIEQEGIFTFSVQAENSAGCTISLMSDTIQSGAKADFRVLDRSICKGDSFTVQLASFDSSLIIDWWVEEDRSLSFVEKDSITFKVLIPDTGSFTISGSSTISGGCSDTLSYNVSVVQVIADFSSNDTFLQCAPVYVQFQSNSINADSLFWDFGDGTSNITTSASAGTIYEKNTGLNDGYDIILIAKNNQGCQDTAIKEDYIVVKGPQPYFRMENFEGCEPLDVQFIDSSLDVVRYFMNYNDGSALDSTSFGEHTYYNTSNSLVQEIWPSIFVYDSLGCGAIFESEVPVVVYKKPNAGFELDFDPEQCIPYNVSFSDTGEFSIASKWYINDMLSSQKRSDTALLTEPGYNEIKLITTNKNYCSDTAATEVFVSGLPDLQLEVLDTLCLAKDINFKLTVIGNDFTDTSGMTILWDFGEDGTPGNLAQGPGTKHFSYSFGGNKVVKVKVILANGCSDSLLSPIYIRDESDLAVDGIHYVSFTDNYAIDLEHEVSTDSRFSRYIVERSDAKRWEADNLFDTSINDIFKIIPTQPMCYTVRIKDICDLEGGRSDEHCFIMLRASSVKAFENQLNWTHYIGWDSIASYKVFRRLVGEAEFKLIAEVDGSQNSYVDTDLCELDYEYYVQATNPYNAFISNSFKVIQKPLYAPNPNLSSIKNVTVTQGNELLINWNATTYDRWNNYVLTKFRADKNEPQLELELTDTFYYDRDVQTSSYSYIYYLKERDICNELNASDREGKSILLEGVYDKASILNWSAYQRWENGVRQYNIQFMDVNGAELIGTTAGNTLGFVDREYHPFVFGPYCYRVFAENDISDTSYSNIVCLEGDPLALIPNAFTPNSDGLNEIFRPTTNFILNGEVAGVNSYKMEIYNRWGEKLFESFDIMEGWDGTYEGKDCQQGVYIYHLNCVGIDGSIFSYQGSITLLR